MASIATKATSVTISTTGSYQLVDLGSGRIIRDINYGRTVQVTPDSGAELYLVSAAGVSPLPSSLAVQGAGAATGQLARDSVVMAGEDGAPRVSRGLTVTVDSTPVGTFVGPVLVRENGSSGVNTCTLGSNRYRGSMEFRLDSNNTITAINELPIEKYLYGVVPSEMPSSWGAEALKAQAVAARNYAMR
ncbi:MAG TPA: SpoIID/LytB domain-containing protein, partial [Bacillota bacterium]|nr:SpoIID/LytB domain-containing protein [Bacillota bacterium]